MKNKNIHKIGKELFITSDEEIKVGDYYINTFVSEREQNPQTHTEKRHLINHQKDYRFKYCKKVILTNNKDLIKDGVQAIEDEFLEWFVKNPSCESIEVVTHYPTIDDEGDGSLSKQYYTLTIPKEQPKQETLEEYINTVVREFKDELAIDFTVGGIKLGAKWQQEQDQNVYLNGYIDGSRSQAKFMYNDEEVLKFTQTIIMQYKFGNTNIEQIDLLKETLEQFKKKQQ